MPSDVIFVCLVPKILCFMRVYAFVLMNTRTKEKNIRKGVFLLAKMEGT